MAHGAARSQEFDESLIKPRCRAGPALCDALYDSAGVMGRSLLVVKYSCYSPGRLFTLQAGFLRSGPAWEYQACVQSGNTCSLPSEGLRSADALIRIFLLSYLGISELFQEREKC